MTIEKTIPLHEERLYEKIAKLCNDHGLNGDQLMHCEPDPLTRKWHFYFLPTVIANNGEPITHDDAHC